MAWSPSKIRRAGFLSCSLFVDGRLARTLWLWLMFITNILSLYFMVSWFPTLATAAGVDISSALIAASLIPIGSICGTLTLPALARAPRPPHGPGLGFVGRG